VATAARLILETLDRHLTGPAHVRLLGGAAFILGYGRSRSTEDADLLLDDAEVQALIDESGFSEALERTNAELEPHGLYLTHIWGPEQQILTAGWRAACREVPLGLPRLTVSVLGPLDLICSKLARADDLDLDDVEWLVRALDLDPGEVLAAARSAMVPDVLRGAWSAALPRLEARLAGRR
jgi:hypothetical protein